MYQDIRFKWISKYGLQVDLNTRQLWITRYDLVVYKQLEFFCSGFGSGSVDFQVHIRLRQYRVCHKNFDTQFSSFSRFYWFEMVILNYQSKITIQKEANKTNLEFLSVLLPEKMALIGVYYYEKDGLQTAFLTYLCHIWLPVAHRPMS